MLGQATQTEVQDNTPVPPRPVVTATMTPGARIMVSHKYYEDNKTAIMADFDRLGEKGTRKRWGITTASWTNLRARFWPEKFTRKKTKTVPLAEIGKAADSNPSPVKVKRADSQKSTLPAFPPFNESWSSEVKCEWLRCLRDLSLAT